MFIIGAIVLSVLSSGSRSEMEKEAKKVQRSQKEAPAQVAPSEGDQENDNSLFPSTSTESSSEPEAVETSEETQTPPPEEKE